MLQWDQNYRKWLNSSDRSYIRREIDELQDNSLLRLYGKLLYEQKDLKQTGRDHLNKFNDYKLLQQTCFDVMEIEEEEIKKFFDENPEAILII